MYENPGWPQPLLPTPMSGGKALGGFCIFSIKITNFYAHFGQNSYFKVITHKLRV